MLIESCDWSKFPACVRDPGGGGRGGTGEVLSEEGKQSQRRVFANPAVDEQEEEVGGKKMKRWRRRRRRQPF